MTAKECKIMAEHGVSLETIHKIHGDMITCPLCDEEQSKEVYRLLRK